MLRSCVCSSYDRQCVCLAEESAAVGAARFKGKPHPFPRQRAADCFRSPSTSYHVWTIIGNFNVPTSLDGGGLYALHFTKAPPSLRSSGTFVPFPGGSLRL